LNIADWKASAVAGLAAVCLSSPVALRAQDSSRDPAPVGAAAAATVFYDAQVFTAEPEHPYAEAVAIRGDRILAVGSRAAVEAVAGPGAREVDLGGKFLMPGMIDAHAHPIDGGLTLIDAQFPDTSGSVPKLVAFVAAQLDKNTSRVGDVLVIYGLDLSYWSHVEEIDAVLSSGPYARRPIVLYGSDGHTGWANRLARTRAGITAKFLRTLPAEDRQHFGATGALEPNGFVVDAGLTKLARSLPPPTADTMLAAGRAAVHYMNAFGITGWLDAAVSGVVGGAVPAKVDEPGNIPVYETLGRGGELTAHVVAYPVVKPDLGFEQIDVVEALRAKYADIPNFQIVGLKVFADGVVEFPSQTAALTQPYRNSGRSGSLLFTPAKLNLLVAEANRRGLVVHIHAIGDLAVKTALDAFEAARTANPGNTLPDTLTHAQFVDPVDFPRFAQLQVFAALQLLWAVDDQVTVDTSQPYLAPEIYRWMYPARSLLDNGAVIAGASDWPVSTANPFEAIYQAETRRGPLGVLDASQRMPREAMLYAYTRNAARVLGQLDQIGTLVPGKRADLVLIDRDVATVPAEELKDASVVWTMFDGKIVYTH
jgi:predicted amidohydrolase YtcJ